ncbi:MAG: HEAT repeat domain-containing protein, partial [Patescibacteria group bacterium]|nr:HEAT repeat domain-containing protein [Patescibacteria group bacterium]
GANEGVFRSVGDESWRVRAEVARAAARFNGPDAEAAVIRLLDDSSSEVHREVLNAIAQWPVEQSGPILLKAMDKESFLCRKTATEQLASHWPPATTFPIEAPTERRRAVLERLTAEFREAFGQQADQQPPGPVAERLDRIVTEDELAEVERLLDQEDAAGLRAIGPVAIEVMEVLAIERQRPVPDAIFRTALPEMHPSFALLARMETDELTERRRAATELATAAEKEPLGRLAVERLCKLVTPEADALVFQSVLAAVARDQSEAAHRIAYAAVGHAAAEVRRRGCLHLAAHPHPKHEPVLLPAVEDESDTVAAAAVQALGACGHASDASSLTELMRSGNEPLQLEAALALVQLGDPSGIAALERLAYSHDSNVRRRVAEQMGELANPAFTPILVRLLDDRVSVMRAALASLPRTVGEDKSISADGASPTTTERVRRWKAWYASR